MARSFQPADHDGLPRTGRRPWRIYGASTLKIDSLARQLLFITVRLQVTKPDRIEAGTGFILNYVDPDSEDKRPAPMLVTNRHVVESATKIEFFMTAKKQDEDAPEIGKVVNIENTEGDSIWTYHPEPKVDIATVFIGPLLNKLKDQGKEVFFRGISSELIPSNDQLEDIDAFEEIIFVGYPVGMFDKKNFTPITRSGTTATPVQLDYQGLPTFLIDASVFPGSSGSPVMLFNKGFYSTPSGGSFAGSSRFFLLGIVAENFSMPQEHDVQLKTAAATPYVQTDQAIDIGVVFNSKAILETAEALWASRVVSKT